LRFSDGLVTLLVTQEEEPVSEPVLIRLEIPFLGWDGEPDGIECNRWLPLADSDAIAVTDPDRSLSLRFTPDCTSSPDMCNPETLQNWANPTLKKVIAEVSLTNISDELIGGILKPDLDNHSDENPHRYFAIEIVNWVLGYVNRLISFAAIQQGQYDLAELALDADNLHSALIRFNAKAKVGASEWVRWNGSSDILVAR
jgi:hypothetical protein